MDIRLPSESISHQGGQPLTFNKWHGDRGKSGKLLQCYGLEVVADLNLTVGTAVIQGEDIYKYIDRIEIEWVGGQCWAANGESSRLEIIRRVRPVRFHEHADESVATADVEYTYWFPFQDFALKNPDDLNIPWWGFKSVVITVASDATLDIGSSAVTINSGSVKVVAHCREIDVIRVPPHWKFATANWGTTTEGRLPLNGALLLSWLTYASGASGGASMANFTDHLIDDLLSPAWERDPDVINWYRHEYGVGDSGTTPGGELYLDPVTAGVCAPIWLPRQGAKILDCPGPVSGDLIVRATNTVSSPISAFTRIGKKADDTKALIATKFGLGEEAFRVDTMAGGMESPSAWGGLATYMPAWAPDPRAPDPAKRVIGAA